MCGAFLYLATDQITVGTTTSNSGDPMFYIQQQRRPVRLPVGVAAEKKMEPDFHRWIEYSKVLVSRSLE